MRCNQCGKIIPNTNQHPINYYGTPMIVCGKHYSQYLKHKKFLDSSPMTFIDNNEYEITEDGVWIYCFNRRYEPSGKFLIDLEDLEIVLSRRWRFWKGNYYTGNFKPIQIHQFLLKPNDGYVIDHINGNRADNRRSNLRITTQQKNLINKALLSNNSSGVAGVSWGKDRKRWEPEIRMDGIRCHLGRYTKLEDAVYVRYVAETILFKEYRSTRNDKRIFEFVNRCTNKDKLKAYVENKLQEKFPA